MKAGDRMKVLILSDSHGEAGHILQAVEQEKPACVIHLGDGWRDLRELELTMPMLPIAQVCGNCDFGAWELPDSRLAEYGGVRVFMCHGHRYNVKAGLLRLTYAAREQNARVALFGHTHQAFCEEHDGLWLLNPGSCGYCARPTCGVLELQNGRVSCCVKAI